MRRKHDVTGPAPRDDAAATDPLRLLVLLRDDDLDAAIDTGLMSFVDDGRHGLDADALALLLATQRRLRLAWDARERHRARSERLMRRQAERDARRPSPSVQASPRHEALPSAAAAALARAKARAGNP